MTQLYTVTIKRKVRTTTFVGKQTFVREIEVDQTYYGMPAATVAGYRKTDPGCIVVAEEITRDTRSSTPSIRMKGDEAPRQKRSFAKELPTPKSITPDATPLPMAQDYGALVTEMAKVN